MHPNDRSHGVAALGTCLLTGFKIARFGPQPTSTLCGQTCGRLRVTEVMERIVSDAAIRAHDFPTLADVV